MKFLRKGEFFGISKKISRFEGLTITETVYPSPVSVPWHYHENPHFTFFLKGHVLEASKKDAFYCIPGSLIFHNSQDPHCDSKHSDYMHYFHVEMDNKWFGQHGFFSKDYEGQEFFNNVRFRGLFHQIYKEFRTNDSVSPLAIEGLLLQVFCEMKRFKERGSAEAPLWVKTLEEFMRANCSQPMTLGLLAMQCGRSPAYLSQVFPKYFRSTFGEYLRKLRIDKATDLLYKENTSLSDVAYEAGFSDQSHFSRCFKEIHGITPREYIKTLRTP